MDINVRGKLEESARDTIVEYYRSYCDDRFDGFLFLA